MLQAFSITQKKVRVKHFFRNEEKTFIVLVHDDISQLTENLLPAILIIDCEQDHTLSYFQNSICCFSLHHCMKSFRFLSVVKQSKKKGPF